MELLHTDELFILRHGETAGESSIRYYGSTDIPLSDIGRRQMMLAGEALRGIGFNSVVTSPLARSRESAALALDGSVSREIVVEDFREIHFGDWEGLTADEIAVRYPELYSRWRVEGRLDGFPNGDIRSDFFLRVSSAAGRIFSGIELPSLAVLHKGVIRGILSRLLEIRYDDLLDHSIELGSIHRLRRTGNTWELVGINETVHLGKYRMEHS